MWRYGLGTAAAFTSDIAEPLGVGLAPLAGLRAVLGPARPPDDAARTRCGTRWCTSSPTAGQLHVTLDAVDREGKFLNGGEEGNFSAGTEADVTVVDPQQKRRHVRLELVAPGRYAVTIPAPQPGAYYLEARLSHQGQVIDTEQLGCVTTFPDELRIRPVNVDLLKDIARQTGGRYDPKPADVAVGGGASVYCEVWLWPYVLAAALAVFLLDLLLKRMAWGTGEAGGARQAACGFAGDTARVSMARGRRRNKQCNAC